MDISLSAITTSPTLSTPPQSNPRTSSQSVSVVRKDTVEFGIYARISTEQSMNVVLERAMSKLRSVVDDARAALGIPEGQVFDTSPEATANRIADFALGAFDQWFENHADLGEQDAKEQFVQFIGGAISQGIQEARDILTALSALTPAIDTNIDTTFDIIQQRLNEFAFGGA